MRNTIFQKAGEIYTPAPERTARLMGRLRERLRREISHSRRILDSLPTVVYTTDRELRLTRINQAFREAARQNNVPQLAENRLILGRCLLDFIAPGPVRDHQARIMAQVLSTGQPDQIALSSASSNSTPEDPYGGDRLAETDRHAILTVSPLVCCDRVEGLIFCCNDITDRVETLRLQVETRRLAEHNDQLQTLSESRGRFLAGILHDMRSPLTAIIGYGEMCRDGQGLSPADLQVNLGFVCEQAERLNDMVEQLLELHQMEGGQRSWRIEQVPPAQAAEKVRQMFLPLATSAGVELVVRAADDLSDVQADADGLARVLGNLVANALKFTRQGCVELRAENWHNQVPLPQDLAWTGQPAVLFAVEDTGQGMDPQECQALFTGPRQHRRGLKGQGFGLGLAICRQIVLAHGGRIWATSQVGLGSRFCVLWPVQWAHSGAAGRIAPVGIDCPGDGQADRRMIGEKP